MAHSLRTEGGSEQEKQGTVHSQENSKRGFTETAQFFSTTE